MNIMLCKPQIINTLQVCLFLDLQCKLPLGATGLNAEFEDEKGGNPIIPGGTICVSIGCIGIRLKFFCIFKKTYY